MARQVSNGFILVVAFFAFGNLLSAVDFLVTPTLVTVTLPATLRHVSGKADVLSDLRTQERSLGGDPELPILEPKFSTAVQIDGSIEDFRMSSDGAYAFFLMLSKLGESRNLIRVRLADASISTWKVRADGTFEANRDGFVVIDRDQQVLRSFDSAGEEVSLSKTDLEAFLRSRTSFQPILPVPRSSSKPRFSFSFKSPLDLSIDWTLAERTTGWFDTAIPSTGLTLRVRSRYASALVLSDGRFWLEQLLSNGRLVNFVLQAPQEWDDPTQLFAPVNSMCVSASGLLYSPYGSIRIEGRWLSGIITVDLHSGKSGPIRYFRTQFAGVQYVDALADGRIVAVTGSEIPGKTTDEFRPRIEICVYGSDSNL